MCVSLNQAKAPARVARRSLSGCCNLPASIRTPITPDGKGLAYMRLRIFVAHHGSRELPKEGSRPVLGRPLGS